MKLSEHHDHPGLGELLALPPLGVRPLVSVVIANYNYGRFLEQAVRSVQRQTYDRWEVIVCDDGSTDDSAAVLERLDNEIQTLRAIYKPNGGQATAWNAALQHVTGEIICFLDSDDRFQPGKLQAVIDAMREEPDAGVVIHRFQPARENGQPVGEPFPREMESGRLMDRAIKRGGWGPEGIASVLTVRTELARRIFPLDPDIGGFGDAYILAVAQFLTPIASIPPALTSYRIHGANDSGGFVPTARDSTVQALARSRLFPLIQRFVAKYHGENISSQLRVDDIPSYWEFLCAAYILSGMPRQGIDGRSPDDLLNGVSRSRRRIVWRTLFRLPSGAANVALRVWWSKGWWKRLTRPLTRRLRLA